MGGHLEQAAAALSAAADQVPIETALQATQQLDTVVQYLQEVGGPLGGRLTLETQGVQTQIQQIMGALSNLRQSIQDGAQQVLSAGA